MNKRYIICLLLVVFSFSSFAQQTTKKLRFAFATDIHLNKQNNGNCLTGLKQALDKIKESKVDFVVFGGDLVDISGMSHNLSKQQTDSMYNVFKLTVDKTKLKYYPTIGNHDRYFDDANGYTEGDEIFKTFFKQSYYTFEKEGVRFFILNSVQKNKEKGGYYVGEKQMEWLKEELSKIPTSTPVVVSTHVPVYSIYYPVVEGKYVFVDVIANYKELLKTFEKHNLKLVLQGHQHLYEEIFSQNVQYITGGAVCASWWSGAFHGTEEGFLIVDVDDNDKFTWEYIDYGWTPK
jgi:3',5'-cyclic AMP phosphodiesterase CpdA